MQYLKYQSFNRTLRSTYKAFFCDRFNQFRSIASPFDSFYCAPSRTACPASTQTFGSKLGQLGPSTHPLCKLWSFWCKGPQPSSANLRIGELTQNFSPSIAWASPRQLIMWSIFQRNAKRRVNQVSQVTKQTNKSEELPKSISLYITCFSMSFMSLMSLWIFKPWRLGWNLMDSSELVWASRPDPSSGWGSFLLLEDAISWLWNDQPRGRTSSSRRFSDFFFTIFLLGNSKWKDLQAIPLGFEWWNAALKPLKAEWVMSDESPGFGTLRSCSKTFSMVYSPWTLTYCGQRTLSCPKPVTSWPHVSFHQATFPVSENVQTIHLALSLSEMVNQGGKKVGKSGNGTDKSSVLDPKFPKCMWRHFEPLLPQWDRDIHVGTWCPNNVGRMLETTVIDQKTTLQKSPLTHFLSGQTCYWLYQDWSLAMGFQASTCTLWHARDA